MDGKLWKRWGREDAARALASYRGSNSVGAVDPFSIAASLGVKVVEGVLPNSIFGLLVRDASGAVTVYLNKTESHLRKRLVCAHELGHFLQQERLASSRYFRIDNYAQGQDVAEQAANEFASSLLLPMEEVFAHVEDGKSGEEIALCFGVAPSVLQHRLEHLFTHSLD